MSPEDRFADPSMIESPYAYFDSLREEGPIYFSKVLQAYFVTRYQDARHILMQPQLFSSSPAASGSMFTNFMETYRAIYLEAGTHPPLPTLVVTDGTTHRRYRKAVDASFTSTSVHKLEAKVLRLIDTLIDGFVDQGRVDLYQAFCLELPLQVICDMVGLPIEDAPQLRRGADAAARLAVAALESEDARVALHRELAQFHLYLQGHIDRCRAQPGDNLLSRMIQATPDDGVPFSDQELISLLTVLNVGGNETTTNGLGNVFALCVQEPRWQPLLRAHPDKIDAFIEEALRLESPVSALPRWVTQDTEVNGTFLPAGACVQMSYAAINRDATQFPEPERLNPERPDVRRHMVFGLGAHFCIGNLLARMELRASLRRLLERLDDIRLDEEAAPLTHDCKLVVRALQALPVRFSRRQ